MEKLSTKSARLRPFADTIPPRGSNTMLRLAHYAFINKSNGAAAAKSSHRVLRTRSTSTSSSSSSSAAVVTPRRRNPILFSSCRGGRTTTMTTMMRSFSTTSSISGISANDIPFLSMREGRPSFAQRSAASQTTIATTTTTREGELSMFAKFNNNNARRHRRSSFSSYRTRSVASSSDATTVPTSSPSSAPLSSEGVNTEAPTFQQAINRLQDYWASKGCAVWLPHNTEVGAGTMNPATFLRCLGPEPWNVCYPEPSVRPDDSRYGDNPNRVQRHTQFQVILKPAPTNPQELYLGSLEALGVDTKAHDIRFVEDNWESPVLGAWGLGWEVWLDGMEVTQFTYFQQCGSVKVNPVTVEITYGLERILMALQNVDHFKDIRYNDSLTYGEMRLQDEYEMSVFNMDIASVENQRLRFDLADKEAQSLIKNRLPLPAYDQLLKASHAFNVLDARGAVGVTERQKLFASMRDLARKIAALWVERREELCYPLGSLVEALGDDKEDRNVKKKKKKNIKQNAAAKPVVPIDESKLPSEKSDFVFEIGTEELPPHDVVSCIQQVELAVNSILEESGLEYGNVSVGGTPRRVSVTIKSLSPKQPDQESRNRGPPLSRAYEEDGVTPTKALLGFCKKNNVVNLDKELEKDDEYVWANVKTVGKSASEVMRDELPKVVESIKFIKTMRWQLNEDNAFSRPLRWLFACHGQSIIPFSALGVSSSNVTRGLRPPGLEAPVEETVNNVQDYLSFMEKEGIVADLDARKNEIWSNAVSLAKSVGGIIPEANKESGDLLDEVANLLETGKPVLGEFEAQYLNLPKEVLITVMKKHQRYFPVENKANGELLNNFVTFANGPCDVSAVKAGNEAVLRARYQDAKFFYENDCKETLETLRPKLEGITFQTELGSMLKKTERVEILAPKVAAALGYGDETSIVNMATKAARLARADLASSMVMELTSLAGVMGEHYAKKCDKLDDTTSKAIFEANLPRFSGDSIASTAPGIVATIADKADTLVGLFAVVGAPKATADPFGLRRTAYGLVQTLVNNDLQNEGGDVRALFGLAKSEQPVDVSDKAMEDCAEFTKRRLEQLLVDAGHDVESVRAILNTDIGFNPARASASVKDLQAAMKDVNTFSKAKNVLSRPTKLIRGKKDFTPSGKIDESLLVEDAEIQFFNAYKKASNKLAANQSIASLIEALAEMEESSTRFFEDVFVNCEDLPTRQNRLDLIDSVASLPKDMIDFSVLPGF